MKLMKSTFNEECAVIERFYNLTPKEAHQKIKTITIKFKSASIFGCLKSKSGEILLEEDEILESWKEYIEELYGDPQRTTNQFKFIAPLPGPAIMKTEIDFALRKTKLNKAMDPDEINTEMIKTFEDIGIDILHCCVLIEFFESISILIYFLKLTRLAVSIE